MIEKHSNSTAKRSLKQGNVSMEAGLVATEAMVVAIRVAEGDKLVESKST